jgi:hypothetical protein
LKEVGAVGMVVHDDGALEEELMHTMDVNCDGASKREAAAGGRLTGMKGRDALAFDGEIPYDRLESF